MSKKTKSKKPDHIIQLTEAQYEHYLMGDGLFIQAPDGSTVFFASDSEQSKIPEPKVFDDNAEGVAILDFVNSLVINSNGYLELNEAACSGLSEVLNMAKQKVRLAA